VNKQVAEDRTPDRKKLGLRPAHVLGFLGSIMALLFGVMLVMPEGGFTVAGIPINFPTVQSFFSLDTTEKLDINSLIADLESDTFVPMGSNVGARGDSALPVNVAGRSLKKIQYPDGNLSVLYPVFEAFEQAASQSQPIRVLHFGDSQIEGDRMTSLIRSRLQERFGGNGPGLIPAKPLVNSMSIVQECSETMQRYTMYGQKDASVKHNRYGAMAIFGRFAPVRQDSSQEKVEHTGWFSFKPAASAATGAKTFNCMKMYYGHNLKPFNLKVFVDDAPFYEDTIPVSRGFRVKTWNFGSTPGKVMVIMSGEDSPDIYGLSLQGNTGVNVDNISMRGSSGTVFGAMDATVFNPMLDSLHPKLLLLQYGGNTIPYIKDKDAAWGYGRQFKGQIELLKKKRPDAGIIVIGPSDMATKIGTEYQSYPNVVHVRDALRQAAFDCGVAYFDIYEVMGGENSMVQWVQAEEPLAGNDYVHFNPRGARIIADAFIKSLLEDYELYVKSKVVN
jgi:lysophospholipase L1-like esterase